MDGTSSPVTHNVYTTGSGGGMGDGGSSSALHTMIPALMAMGMGGGGGGGQQHHHHHMQTGTGTDTSALHSMAGLAAGGALGGRNQGWGAGMGGMGAAAGGVVGLIIGALLSNNGGFFGGNRRDGNFVTPTDLTTSLNQQTQNQNTNAILQELSAIAVSIPQNEGRVQLAISQSQNALQNQASQGQLQVAATTSTLQNDIANARHSVNDNIHVLGTNTSAGFGALQLQAANINATTLQALAGLSLQGAQQTAVIQTSIRDDGDRTRALIIAQNDATLNRIITEQANAIIELRNERGIATSGLNITQTVNQAQAQTQLQQQQQQQFSILTQIAAVLSTLQSAVATNSNLIIGNSGATTTGAQTANPVNVR